MSELSQEARALIDSVSTLDDPSADDRTRIRKRLAMQLGASAFAVGTVTNVGGITSKSIAASKSGLFGMAGKAALCAGALCAAGSIWLLDWHGEPSRAPVPARSAEGALRAQVPAVVAAPAPAAEPLLVPAEPLPAPEAPRVRRKLAPSEAAAPQAIKPVAANSLAAELSLLGRAQAALRAGNPAQALALAREHEATFPEGVLKEERLGVAALSECTLVPEVAADLGAGAGLRVSAHKHAQAFLAAAPNSPLAARVRKACGLE